jgi:hypothetical protein
VPYSDVGGSRDQAQTGNSRRDPDQQDEAQFEVGMLWHAALSDKTVETCAAFPRCLVRPRVTR